MQKENDISFLEMIRNCLKLGGEEENEKVDKGWKGNDLWNF